MSDSVRPHRRQPTRLPRPWDSPGKNTGVGCHFLLQCMRVKSEREVAQSCPTLRDPMDCSPPGSSVHGIFQARGLEWGAIAFSFQKLGHTFKGLKARAYQSPSLPRVTTARRVPSDSHTGVPAKVPEAPDLLPWHETSLWWFPQIQSLSCSFFKKIFYFFFLPLTHFTHFSLPPSPCLWQPPVYPLVL